MFEEHIKEGFDVFLHDGDKSVGAVRQVRGGSIVIYVENGGDFIVSMDAVADVHSEKVVLNAARLDSSLRQAIGHAHAAEDPRI